jgi:hypothetical protein
MEVRKLMVITDILHKLVEHSSLNGDDKQDLHAQVAGLEDGGLTVTSAEAEARAAQAAADARAARIAKVKAELATLEGDA